MSYYEKHVFFCCNQRTNGEACCADKGAQDMRDYAKKRVKELGLAGPGKVRVNQAGCLDRCEEGPCIVVYPDAVWYTYVDRADVDEIIEEHLKAGRVGDRLFIAGGAGRIETVLDRPEGKARGVALIAHPHPLYGGTLDNKVVQTL